MHKKQFVSGAFVFASVAVLTIVVGLAACSPQPAPAPATQEQQIQTLPEVSNPYPGQQPAYPSASQPANPPAAGAYPPAQAEPMQVDTTYPEAADGAEIRWEQALGLLLNGQVTRVTQRHDLTVSLVLKDGRTLQVLQPAIDEVLKVIETCGDPCKDILVATE